MIKLKKVLAPTDFSELSQVGVRYAVDLAETQGAEVTVYHVIRYEETGIYEPGPEGWIASPQEFRPIQELVDERKNDLANFVNTNFSKLPPKVTVKQEVEVGVPHRKIVQKAKSNAVDMIVMSTHGTTGLMHLLIGSVTEQVVRRCTCPVLVIRPESKA